MEATLKRFGLFTVALLQAFLERKEGFENPVMIACLLHVLQHEGALYCED
jgi:hypothetical protein